MKQQAHNHGDLLDDRACRRLASATIVGAVIAGDWGFLQSDACEDFCSELSGEMDFTPQDLLGKMRELGMEKMTGLERLRALTEEARRIFGRVGQTEEEGYQRVMSGTCPDCGKSISKASARCASCAQKHAARERARVKSG